MQILESLEKEIQTETAKRLKLKNFIVENQAALEPFGDILSLACWRDGLDFDNPTRQQTLDIIKAFPGTWQKRTSGPTMHYELSVKGFLLRCYNAELPPSCKIVRKAVIIPEHEEVVEEIKCDLPVADATEEQQT
jgi:hypothetical protein